MVIKVSSCKTFFFRSLIDRTSVTCQLKLKLKRINIQTILIKGVWYDFMKLADILQTRREIKRRSDIRYQTNIKLGNWKYMFFSRYWRFLCNERIFKIEILTYTRWHRLLVRRRKNASTSQIISDMFLLWNLHTTSKLKLWAQIGSWAS